MLHVDVDQLLILRIVLDSERASGANRLNFSTSRAIQCTSAGMISSACVNDSRSWWRGRCPSLLFSRGRGIVLAVGRSALRGACSRDQHGPSGDLTGGEAFEHFVDFRKWVSFNCRYQAPRAG